MHGLKRTWRQFLHIHGGNTYMYREVTVTCTGRSLLHVHEDHCYMHREVTVTGTAR